MATSRDTFAIVTTSVTCLLLLGGAAYISQMAPEAGEKATQSLAQLRSIVAFAASVAMAATWWLSRQFDVAAAETERQRRFPPEGLRNVPDNVADACSGDPALLVAAELRGHALLLRCVGAGLALAGALFVFGL